MPKISSKSKKKTKTSTDTIDECLDSENKSMLGQVIAFRACDVFYEDYDKIDDRYAALLVALLERTFLDLRHEDKRIRKEARVWVLANRQNDFGFGWVVEILGCSRLAKELRKLAYISDY